WSWNYTTWTTNELDTETVPVRLLLLALMLVSLLMAVAIPQAFEAHALLFAGSYVAIQIGRHAFLTFAAADRGSVERERAGHILTWFAVVGVLWVAGALLDGPERIVLWLVALALDYCAPLVTYWIPGRRRLAPATWNVGTEHFAERFGLFIILALGESIVITGATTSDLDLDAARIIAFIMAFLASAALWWLYFSSVASLGEHYLEVSENRTILARDAYTYLHVVFVAGIILSAVGDELVIAHPTEMLPPYEVATVTAGPAVYLFAHTLFGYRLTGVVYKTKVFGTLACVTVGVVGLLVPALVLAGLLIVVLVAVIGSSHLAPSRAEAEGEDLPRSSLRKG
ncbi:MAG TPA: low temperature requirement protein A, partial [Rubrobacter sp.]|nr:low temperature requirement protein A [Rubrobacter sp.]